MNIYTSKYHKNHMKRIWGRDQVGKYVAQLALLWKILSTFGIMLLIWQGHRLPTLIQYYPNSGASWTWQKEVIKVKPFYYMPHCLGPSTSPSNCPLTVCQKMFKGH